jgi:hypothetical protein
MSWWKAWLRSPLTLYGHAPDLSPPPQSIFSSARSGLAHRVPLLSAMSMFMIFGFFALTNGRRISKLRTTAENPSQKTTYILYDTVIQCQTGKEIAGEIRVFAPSHVAILKDETVAYIVARTTIQPEDGAKAYLDIYTIAEVPGDPSKDTYQDVIPNVNYPHVFAIGQVVDETSLPDNKVAYAILVTEYIKDQSTECTIQWAPSFPHLYLAHASLPRCFIDKERKRWAKTRAPRLQSIVGIYGQCADLTTANMLLVEIQSIVFNLGTLLTSSTQSSMTSPHISPKKRKFAAVLSSSGATDTT